MKKRLVLLLVTAMAATTVLAGCGSKSDNAAGTEAASGSASASPSCRIPCGSGARTDCRRRG